MHSLFRFYRFFTETFSFRDSVILINSVSVCLCIQFKNYIVTIIKPYCRFVFFIFPVKKSHQKNQRSDSVSTDKNNLSPVILQKIPVKSFQKSAYPIINIGAGFTASETIKNSCGAFFFVSFLSGFIKRVEITPFLFPVWSSLYLVSEFSIWDKIFSAVWRLLCKVRTIQLFVSHRAKA